MVPRTDFSELVLLGVLFVLQNIQALTRNHYISFVMLLGIRLSHHDAHLSLVFTIRTSIMRDASALTF